MSTGSADGGTLSFSTNMVMSPGLVIPILYVSDGINSLVITPTTTLPGPTGPMGTQGSTGAQGPRGFQGQIGPTGLGGEPGMKGYTGPTGEPGMKGYTGATGPAGEPGMKGFTGPTGPAGEPGMKGFTGPTGSTGPPGIIRKRILLNQVCANATNGPGIVNNWCATYTGSGGTVEVTAQIMAGTTIPSSTGGRYSYNLLRDGVVVSTGYMYFSLTNVFFVLPTLVYIGGPEYGSHTYNICLGNNLHVDMNVACTMVVTEY